MIIPNKVKIGAHEYQIVHRDDTGESDGRYGHCDSKKLKIYIDDRNPQSQQEETFFHESLHAICELGHLFPKGKDGQMEEEKLVQPMGHGIYQFLKENKLLKDDHLAR